MDPVNRWYTITLSYGQWCALRAHLVHLPHRPPPHLTCPFWCARSQVDGVTAEGEIDGWGIGGRPLSRRFRRSWLRAILAARPDMTTESAALTYAYAVVQNALGSAPPVAPEGYPEPTGDAGVWYRALLSIAHSDEEHPPPTAYSLRRRAWEALRCVREANA